MPKIIDNVKEKIHKSAFKLFAQNGYNNVSMKLVADETKIAVGTLYNYYSNKMELFLNVFRGHINQIYLVLNDIAEEGGDIKDCITVLYDEIMGISGFSDEILKNTIINSKSSEFIAEIKKDFIQNMKELIITFKVKNRDNFENKNIINSGNDEERIIRLLILTIIDFAREFPDERDENILFISNLISKLK